MRWCRSKTCLTNKVALITGANSGIGFETATDLAKRGARVILGCRNTAKAETAKTQIIEATGNENIAIGIVDFASFSSIRKFAKEILENEDRLDILVNNIGTVGIDKARSEDGFVLSMQVNYLSHFLLTLLLIDLLKRTGNSRIVNVSSISAKLAWNYDIASLTKDQGDSVLYFNTKLYLILFTIELASRLKETGVTTYSVHPGAVDTDIFQKLKGYKRIAYYFWKPVIRTPEEGAQTVIYCCVEKGIENENGNHFVDCHKVRTYRKARKVGLALDLWNATVDIVELQSDEVKL